MRGNFAAIINRLLSNYEAIVQRLRHDSKAIAQSQRFQSDFAISAKLLDSDWNTISGLSSDFAANSERWEGSMKVER
jgi:hypothetical protein